MGWISVETGGVNLVGQLVSVKYRRCESLVAGACPDLDSWSRDHIPHIMSPALPWSQPPGHRCQVQTWSQSGHIQGGTRIKGVFGRNYQNIKRFGNQELESQIRISKLFSTQNTRSIINKYWPLFGSHWQQLPSSSHFYKARSMAQNVICNRDRAE